jgi:UDP-3-O-[3-hydroxymyristoyl] N-acetylglucosamine deacetylase
LTIAPAIDGGIRFQDFSSSKSQLPAEVSRVSYDASWSGLPGAVPVRNTTLMVLERGLAHVAATVEHVMSALAGLGIWNAVIVMDGPEVPILDGSAKPWVDVLASVLKQGPAVAPITLARPVEVRDADASITATPADIISYTYNLDYGPASPLKPHSATWRGDADDFAANIALARTFSLRPEAQAAQKMGLFNHLSPRDMLVIGDDGHPMDNAWRMENEPARHKLLDLIGDLALLRRPVIANVVATKSGHRLTHEFCRAVLKAMQ